MIGRGLEAREITKKEDPEYYEKRMKGMWIGYVLIPLLTAAVGNFRYREANRNNDGKET